MDPITYVLLNLFQLYAVNTINQIGQKEQMIFHAKPKSESKMFKMKKKSF